MRTYHIVYWPPELDCETEAVITADSLEDAMRWAADRGDDDPEITELDDDA